MGLTGNDELFYTIFNSAANGLIALRPVYNKEKIEDFDPGYSKLTLNGNRLEIINSYNDGYEAAKIQFVINKDLTIENVDYSFSDDAEDGSTDKYEVIESKLNLNKKLG